MVPRCGLRALDLRGEHGLAADVGVEEKLGIGEQGAHAVKPAEGKGGTFQQALPVSGKVERRLRRQRNRHEGTHRFATGGGGFVVAGGVAIHGANL
jgi:hypothetical protein